ncbi:MAG: bifunctional (p)ppGpp synthetase/guanosine-3',5'-bis(diphosphate) 3'-pyrophosphohydrolase [Candidatus Hydrogenedens sp.]|nr:HD domain-containing protein [Candidatus Hydrogenedentota bacterium]NLF56687.1 bifunctional (p)ppGpp synthetase/guanosine-3',5'-bis(diphosphate) 3'-pyrophosphohydrolase [Candidatus Hydrogenedens sp.]
MTRQSYSHRVPEALALMFELHRDQRRKGEGGAPYVVHLLGVAALVGEFGGDEDQFIAALLHDAAEDQGGMAVLGRIRDTFGEKVADLVLACSDTVEEVKPPWKERKLRHIAHVAEAPAGVKLIIAADKLHNARSLWASLRQSGPRDTWKHFKGGRDGSLWYYQSMLDALRTGWDSPLLEMFEETLADLNRIA